MQPLALLLFLVLSAGQRSANGAIEGTVLRTGTTGPVAQAEVTLTLAGKTARTLTDSEGRFSFVGLAPGTYAIRIQRDGYFGSSVAGSTERSQQGLFDSLAFSTGTIVGDRAPTPPATASIELTASQHRTGLVYYLTPGGILTGHVMGTARPFPGATVTALRLGFRNGQRALTPVKSTLADDRGEFRISWLEVGEYVVRAEAILPDGKARSYFPGTSSPNQAVKVRVEESQESRPITILLGAAPGVTLSGAIANMNIVVPQSTATQRTSRFILFPADPNVILESSPDVENSVADLADRLAGKFEIQGVRPGTYDLVSIFSERLVGVSLSSKFPVYVGRSRLVVGSEDVRGITLTVSRGSDVHGRLTNMKNVALPAASAYRVRLVPAGLMSMISYNLSAEVSQDGTFTIPEVPALPFSLALSGISLDTYIADLLQDGRSVFDTGTLTVGSAGTNVEVVLNSPGAEITGNVSASSQQLATGVSVVLVPLEQPANMMLYRRIVLSRAGAFSIAGVVPGPYRLLAFEDLPSTAEFDRSFLELFRNEGAEITATGARTATVQLSLIPRDK